MCSPVGFAKGAAGFAGVANERGDRIAAREYAADDLAADAAGGADHCGGHRGSCLMPSRCWRPWTTRSDAPLATIEVLRSFGYRSTRRFGSSCRSRSECNLQRRITRGSDEEPRGAGATAEWLLVTP
jgi:hypothetical protein